MARDKDEPVQTDLFDNQPLTILKGSIGLVAPDNREENKLFSQIADMRLQTPQEGVYAEMAKMLAGVRNSVYNRPMVVPANPIRSELADLFDKIDA